MTTHFQSGLSLTQARKDAKKMARDVGIPLHKALDNIAQEHHGNTWSKSLRALKAVSHANALTLPFLSLNQHTVDWTLTRSEPLGIIDGFTGCGKTIAALIIAEQHLLSDQYVHYFSGFHASTSAHEDLGTTLAKQYAADFPEQFFIHHGDKFSGVDRWDFHDNALVIVDEINQFARHKGFTDTLLQLIKNTSVYILLLSQCIEDIPDIDKILIFMSSLLIGVRTDWEMGRNTEYLKSFLTDKPDIQRNIEQQKLGFDRFSQESKFLLIQRDCADIVRFALSESIAEVSP